MENYHPFRGVLICKSVLCVKIIQGRFIRGMPVFFAWRRLARRSWAECALFLLWNSFFPSICRLFSLEILVVLDNGALRWKLPVETSRLPVDSSFRPVGLSKLPVDFSFLPVDPGFRPVDFLFRPVETRIIWFSRRFEPYYFHLKCFIAVFSVFLSLIRFCFD